MSPTTPTAAQIEAGQRFVAIPGVDGVVVRRPDGTIVKVKPVVPTATAGGKQGNV